MINEIELKKKIIENFNYISSLSVKEFILYRKWVELNELDKDWILQHYQKIQEIKQKIWMPKNVQEYHNLNIKIIPVTSPDLNLDWTIIRKFVHSTPAITPPGRNSKFLVVHEETQPNFFGFGDDVVHKYIGIICLASDFIQIGGRDKVIGWTRDDRLKHKMLNHVAMASTIMPTQPFGFNFLGGKLIALLTASDVVENHWNSLYKEQLAGITTTSLYGGFSQYNRLNYWKKCESSDGRIPIEPSEDIFEQIREWFKIKFPMEYKEIISSENKVITCHPKGKILNKTMTYLKIKAPLNNAPRGVYWCELFENTNKFLQRKDEKLGIKKFDNSIESLVQLWKNRYVENRLKNLTQSGKFNLTDCLFYDNILNKSWEETKRLYEI